MSSTITELYDSDAFRRAVDSARELETTAVRLELGKPDGAYKWPRYHINEVELEWRRLRLRTRLGLPTDVAHSVKVFDRMFAERHGPAPSDIVEGAQSIQGSMLAGYDVMFPQGALITKANRARLLRPEVDDFDSVYSGQMRESALRRDAYLARLKPRSYWWRINDIVTAKAQRECAKEMTEMQSLTGKAYGGAPTPGWDVEHDVLTSRSSNTYIPAGPKLAAIHEDPALVAAISEHMGRPFYPTRCAYLRYGVDDSLGVHTDMPTAEVSVLFTVEGEPGPLRSYVEETMSTPRTLHEWVAASGAFPEGGFDICYAQGEGFALTGRAVPHARLPQASETVVAGLFYSGIV